ncbi:HlyD family type I secretion periplasmic adaptor subunit [Moritella viscosa]|uniref:Membrane fusion protein (MFP) family protein n=1 Tax=Moritella viscosa TaxID=80854 RepID=A0A090IH06_9GAMM|nr:HlyD family type I secretion periplasmic adaptor subunit [Moritella viscosa]CED61536.1 proteases secretion protein prtE [Moritella viscosa]SGY89450.1 HlyD family secretion protein [Moritella viscosa]SGY97491.1 HlyD family secretion protein [Moritella viscosa]SGY97617.1 HlyD family secretion protein [Moritella viscosa]SHO04779.1 HlyD family secretion protein [Moritella viscosa]
MDSSNAVTNTIQKWLMSGWYIILFGFLGFIIWATLAPLDQGVPLPAYVVVSGDRQNIQSLNLGRITAMPVQEGQFVQQGQLLIQLDDAQLHSKLDTNLVQYITKNAVQLRLESEQQTTNKIIWSKTLQQLANESLVGQEIMNLQQTLLLSNQGNYNNSIDALQQEINSLIATKEGLILSLKSREKESTILNKQFKSYQLLLKKGYASESIKWEAERTLAKVDSEIANLQGQVNTVIHNIARAQANREQFKTHKQQQINEELAEVRLAAEVLKEQRNQLQLQLENTTLRAPIAGTIVGLKVFRAGQVVNTGDILMEIVPVDSPLVIQAQLPISLRDKVFTHAPVDLSFVAFSQSTTPKVSGVLTKIAADSLRDQYTGEYFYQLEAKLNDDAKQQLTRLKIEPGMPVQMFVKTGERSLMNYLLKPLYDRLDITFSEG